MLIYLPPLVSHSFADLKLLGFFELDNPRRKIYLKNLRVLFDLSFRKSESIETLIALVLELILRGVKMLRRDKIKAEPTMLYFDQDSFSSHQYFYISFFSDPSFHLRG